MTAGCCARLGCDAPVTRQNRSGRGVRVNEGFSMGRIVRDLEVHHRDWTDAVLAGYFGRPLARAFSEGPPARSLRQTESFPLSRVHSARCQRPRACNSRTVTSSAPAGAAGSAGRLKLECSGDDGLGPGGRGGEIFRGEDYPLP
jgi:hypothetical protein